MAISYQFDNRGLYFTDSDNNIHLGHKLTIDEQLSTPFTITGVLVSNNFVAADQLGQPLSCHWNEIADNKQKEKRVFHGYLTEIVQLDAQSDQNYVHYQITLRPWLWLLTLRSNYRVFQQQTLSSILSAVFDDAGFSGNYTLGTLPTDERNYCVQYDETDFAFVQRLLAEQGIHYYFTFTSNSHQLTLHDPSSPYEDAEVSKLDYIGQRSGEQQLISQWQPRLRVHSKSVNTVNYDYASSQLIDSGDKTSSHTIANNQKLTQYHFGAHSVKGDISDVNSTIAENQLNKVQGDYSAVEAASQVEELTLATQFTLANHPDSSQVGKYAIESIIHTRDASVQAVID